MKILFFIDCLMPGGKERRFVEHLKGLKSYPNFEFELVVMNKEVHYKEVFELGKKIHFLIRRTKKDFSVFGKIYKICKNYQPDIVHCFDSMTAVYLIPACCLLKIKFVNGLICDAPQKLDNKSWFRANATFPFSSVIIGNSFAGLKAYKAPKNKSFVIHNGYDFKRIEKIIECHDIRAELEIKTDFVVGMVASFSKYKDYLTYFRAAQLILSKRNDVTFLAIGRNTDSAESRNLIDRKYQSAIKTIGKRSNIESYIKMMDVCVLATFTEGISNSIMEYMALGKAVIATSGGGTSEIVEDGKTGFLVRVSAPEELAEKINLLLNDSNLRSSIGTNGKKRILQYFSIDSMLNKYVTIYENLKKKISNA